MNPRLLADEVAGVLRSIGPEDRAVEQQHLTLSMFDTSSGPGVITYGLLADYFESFAQGHTAETINTTTGEIRAATVLLSRQMIGRIVVEAGGRAELAAGYVTAVHTEPAHQSSALRKSNEQAPPPGSSTFMLGKREQQQRQEGDQQAAKQLDAVNQENASLKQLVARLQAENSQAQWAKQDAENRTEQHRREAQDECRKRTLAEEQLRDHAGIIAFMDAGNPLAPVEGQRLVNAWCDITNNGTENNVSLKGKGLSSQIIDWLQRNFPGYAACAPSRYTWALTWPARKKGGVAAKEPSKKA